MLTWRMCQLSVLSVPPPDLWHRSSSIRQVTSSQMTSKSVLSRTPRLTLHVTAAAIRHCPQEPLHTRRVSVTVTKAVCHAGFDGCRDRQRNTDKHQNASPPQTSAVTTQQAHCSIEESAALPSLESAATPYTVRSSKFVFVLKATMQLLTPAISIGAYS